MKKELIISMTVSFLLTGCTGAELSSFNKQISDIGFMVADGNSKSGSGMPKLTSEVKESQNEKKMDESVTVDVDTAAARLRRYYKFMTTEELNAIKNRSDDLGGWVAGSIENDHPEWTALPGSFYKMGRDWGEKDDHIVIDVEKNGAGSRVYVTFSSSNSQHLTDKYLGGLFSQIKGVVEGSIR